MSTASISFVKGKGSLAHNNRVFTTKNVDAKRSIYNITYKQESLETAYEHCFAKAIDDYNAKQKRADRKIDGVKGYLNQIRTSKNGEKLFYENLIQVGNMFDSKTDTYQGINCKNILNDYMQAFQQRNPNLYVFNAVMHLDEQTPHLHIDYIPVAHDYKTGLQARNSLDKALKQQGLDGKASKYENRTLAWQEREKDYIASIMPKYGLERSEDKGLKRKHLTVEHYKAVAERIRNEAENIQDTTTGKPMFFFKNKVIVNKDELESLKHKATLTKLAEKSNAAMLTEGEANLNHKKKALDIQTQEYYNKCIQVDKLYKKYVELYNHQRALNTEYSNLRQANATMQDTIKTLKTDNTDKDNTIRIMTDNITKAMSHLDSTLNMYLYDKEYAMTSPGQIKLMKATINYIKSQASIQDDIGIPEAIQQELDKLTPKAKPKPKPKPKAKSKGLERGD